MPRGASRREGCGRIRILHVGWIINLVPLFSSSPPTLPFFTLSSVSGLLFSFPSFLRTIPALSPTNIHQTLTIILTHLTPFTQLLPALCHSLLFFSSTIYSERLSLSKYPTGYRAYQGRVGMFGFVATLLKGLKLQWTGRKAEVEELIWGKEGKDE